MIAMRPLTTLVLVALVAVSLSGCGRKGRPVPPDDAVTRTYPDIQFPPQSGPAKDRVEGSESPAR